MNNTKIIYDNIIYSLQNVGGISNYWTELVKRISKKKSTTFYEWKNYNIHRKKINLRTIKESQITPKILRYFSFQKILPTKSIFHSSYLRTTFQKDIVNITTIHDFTYEHFEKGISQIVHSWQKKLAIENSDGIICVSDNTKKDLFKFFPNIKKEKVATIYNGVGKIFFPIKDWKNKIKDNKLKKIYDKKIILFVGNRKKLYKNFFVTVDTVSSLNNFILVSVGGDKITQIEQNYINQKIPGRFHHFSKVRPHKLNKIYNISFCLLYPSLYEGFGLPIVEAMKAGCPVISTKKSSIKEIADGAAILVDKPNKESFVNAIKSVSNKRLRRKLINCGLSRAKKFDWEKCSVETFKFYKKIYKMKFHKLKD